MSLEKPPLELGKDIEGYGTPEEQKRILEAALSDGFGSEKYKDLKRAIVYYKTLEDAIIREDPFSNLVESFDMSQEVRELDLNIDEMIEKLSKGVEESTLNEFKQLKEDILKVRNLRKQLFQQAQKSETETLAKFIQKDSAELQTNKELLESQGQEIIKMLIDAMRIYEQQKMYFKSIGKTSFDELTEDEQAGFFWYSSPDDELTPPNNLKENFKDQKFD